MRNPWSPSLVGALLLFVGLVVGLIVGYWWHGNVEAYNRNMVAIGELQPPASHLVARGDTLWDLAVEYYPTVRHKGRVVDAIRRMNPDIDPGNLRVGVDWIDLPRIEEVR